ncbi:hypothetical protein DFR49_0899 [Hephaestia caeni]|uniref:Uncharacterized protein n=1 Tax=Hephaestia caeni TaxID=645617 RepID=A0A397PEL9_9SPHN|nr:hypothetical protein [Hephaestia caeni]RIA46359.1 hypothetical protein DFR49_0899 [Hephaestia caeni]
MGALRERTEDGTDTTQTWIARVRAAAQGLLAHGNAIGHYVARIDEHAIATQRDTKDKLPGRLRASSETPQIVTVQARGGERAQAYVIIPIDKFAETLEAAQDDEDDFVPITARMRMIDAGAELPVLSPRRSDRRRRSERASVPALAGERHGV